MFKLKADDVFTWPVKAKRPEDGKHIPVNFNATFKVLAQERVLELLESGGQIAVLREAVVSVDHPVADENDNDVTDEDERREIILKVSWLIEPLADAWRAGMEGRKAKN